MRILTTLLHDERGQGLAEYSLLLALIAVACIGATRNIGIQIGALLNQIGNDLP